MSVDSPVSGEGPESIGACKNAEEFAKRRLNQSEEAMRPSQLAEEYECTPSHMRGALRNLRKEGQVERVEHGEYVAAGGDSSTENVSEDGDDVGGDESLRDDGNAAAAGTSEDAGAEGTWGAADPSEDGVRHSHDIATTDGLQDDEEALEERFDELSEKVDRLAQELEDLDVAEPDDDHSNDYDDRDDGEQEVLETEVVESSSVPGIPLKFIGILVAVGLGIVAVRRFAAGSDESDRSQDSTRDASTETTLVEN